MCGYRQTLIALLALAPLAGCARQTPEFNSREEMADLMPEAQQYVRDVLDNKFGQPTESNLWERLPVRYHAVSATVAEEPEPTVGEFAIEITEQTLPIEAGENGMEVVFLSGDVTAQRRAAAGAEDDESEEEVVPPVLVADYDEEAALLTLSEPLPAAPAAGDRLAVGPGALFQQGRLLYAEHCQHCHGVTGDGAGPTAEYLNPPPRDYRNGIFKFTSTISVRRAQRADLADTIENGIPGTYMPSFKLLEPAEMDALVEYVLWLAMRGETELKLVELLKFDYSEEAVEQTIEGERRRLEQDRESRPPDQIDESNYLHTRENIVEAFAERLDEISQEADGYADQVAGAWSVSQEDDSLVLPSIPRPPATPESIASGREVFLSAEAKCAACHGEAGLGNGEQTLLVQQGYDVPGLFDAWGNPIEPRNLTTGIYRGGRRPIDIYRRIHAGIKGTPMTGFGTSLSDEKIWDLVNYVLSIPFEEREPGEGGFVPSEPASESAQPPQVAAREE